MGLSSFSCVFKVNIIYIKNCFFKNIKTFQKEEARAAVTAGIGAGVVGAIQVLNGANAGRELELTKTLTTLGKPGVQVAVIARRPSGYFITHVEGGQFPLLNGKVLDAQAHALVTMM